MANNNFVLDHLESTKIYEFVHKNCVTFLSNNICNKYFCYEKYLRGSIGVRAGTHLELHVNPLFRLLYLL